MRVLVIPDVHLKPWMFERAADLMEKFPDGDIRKPNRAVCLMDIADDWRKQYDLELYVETYNAAIDFARKYPDTLWCYGNHDLSYLWNRPETGYSPVAPRLVCEKLKELQNALPDKRQIAYLHRIENVLFSHAGLSDSFVRDYVPAEEYKHTDVVVNSVNGLGSGDMWRDSSPIWCRPQYSAYYSTYGLYKPDELLQVVGHTPVQAITRTGNLLSCDVFSTYETGEPIGSQAFPLIDTENWTCVGIVI